MATAYTSLLGLALPVTGELSGTWGATVNDEITALLDSAVAGTTSITADADITLSDTDGAANETRQAVILWNPATGTTTRNITAPARSKAYIVINASGGTQSIVLRGAGPTTGVTIIKGEKALCAWDGSDFVKVANQNGIGNFTTVDTTNLEVTNLKALDGTAAGSIANSTGVVTLASSVLTTTDINGGTIDGTAIGGASAAAGAFTTLSASSTLTVTGAGSIQGLTVGRGAGAVSTNTAVGASALAANTSGAENTAVGQGAAAATTTGNYNTAMGRNTFALNTTGSSNAAFGQAAMYNNTTGENGSAFGYASLASNTTGGNNTAVGYQAAYANTTAGGNVAIGYRALYTSQTSSSVVAIGASALNIATQCFASTVVGDGAGRSVTTGDRNTLIGQGAGSALTTGQSNTIVGPRTPGGTEPGGAITTGSKNTILGAYSGNQDSLDIRTLSNYIVLSDGDGYPAFWGQGGSGGYMKLEAGRLEFPATQNASSNANTLDDYEEGTWTPLVGSDSTGAFTMGTVFGRYTKVGNMVTVICYAAWSARPSGGNVAVTGFPFNINNFTGGGNIATTFITKSATDAVLENTTLGYDGNGVAGTMYIYTYSRSGLVAVNSLSAAGFLAFTGTYFV